MKKKGDSKELVIHIPRISAGSVPQTAFFPLRKIYTFSYSFVVLLNHFLCGNKIFEKYILALFASICLLYFTVPMLYIQFYYHEITLHNCFGSYSTLISKQRKCPPSPNNINNNKLLFLRD